MYRHGRFGDCLVEALDDLMGAGKITPDLAFRVLAEFDEVILPVSLLTALRFYYKILL